MTNPPKFLDMTEEQVRDLPVDPDWRNRDDEVMTELVGGGFIEVYPDYTRSPVIGFEDCLRNENP